jgi:hypothetical protein
MHVNCRKIVEKIANQTNCRKRRRQIVENGADEVRRTGEFDELGFDELGFDELGFDEVSFMASSTNWGSTNWGSTNWGSTNCGCTVHT